MAETDPVICLKTKVNSELPGTFKNNNTNKKNNKKSSVFLLKVGFLTFIVLWVFSFPLFLKVGTLRLLKFLLFLQHEMKQYRKQYFSRPMTSHQ